MLRIVFIINDSPAYPRYARALIINYKPHGHLLLAALALGSLLISYKTIRSKGDSY